MHLFDFLHINSAIKIYYPVVNNIVMVTKDTLSNNDEETCEFNGGQLCIIQTRDEIFLTAIFLKLHSLIRATQAIDATVVDLVGNRLRFNLLYFLQSQVINTRITLLTWTSEIHPAISLQSIYPAFNWSEREIWDLFGLFFIRHPDLRRILTDYGFSGHPMRKDFPLTGFREVHFEDLWKRVEYNQTELAQSYRLLAYKNAWHKE